MNQTVQIVLAFALVATASWLLWIGAQRTLALFALPYPTDTLEGTLLSEALLIRAGEPLYQPLVPDRFVSAPYPPLHPLLLAIADGWAGPHRFWSGRLISLIAAASVAVTAAILVLRLGGGLSAALAAAALLVSAPPIAIWGARIKPDMLGLALTALGLLCATHALVARPARAQPARVAPLPTAFDPRPPDEHPVAAADVRHPTVHPVTAVDVRPSLGVNSVTASGASAIPSARSHSEALWLILALCCFVCAFFTKQTMILAPLAVGLTLLWRDVVVAGGWLAALRRPWAVPRAPTWGFGLGYLGAAFGTWALLDVFTGGQYTVHVWWGSARAQWWSFELFRKVVELLGTYLPLIGLAALLLLTGWGRRRTTDHGPRTTDHGPRTTDTTGSALTDHATGTTPSSVVGGPSSGAATPSSIVDGPLSSAQAAPASSIVDDPSSHSEDAFRNTNTQTHTNAPLPRSPAPPLPRSPAPPLPPPAPPLSRPLVPPPLVRAACAALAARCWRNRLTP